MKLAALLLISSVASIRIREDPYSDAPAFRPDKPYDLPKHPLENPPVLKEQKTLEEKYLKQWKETKDMTAKEAVAAGYSATKYGKGKKEPLDPVGAGEKAKEKEEAKAAEEAKEKDDKAKEEAKQTGVEPEKKPSIAPPTQSSPDKPQERDD